MEVLPYHGSLQTQYSSKSHHDEINEQFAMQTIDLTKELSEELPKYAFKDNFNYHVKDPAEGSTVDSLKDATKVSTENGMNVSSNASTQVILSNGSVKNGNDEPCLSMKTESLPMQTEPLPVQHKPTHEENSENLKTKKKVQKSQTPHPRSAAKPSDREDPDTSEMRQLSAMLPELEIFKLHRKVGEGTFSRVYLASLVGDPDQVFALKHHVPTSAPSRVEWELKCLQEIGGRDNVIGVKCAFRRGDCTVFVMPYLPHKRFSDIVLDMGVAETRHYIRGLLVALARVHSFGIIHRDVKPSNYLYNRETKECLLIDFGLANKSCAPNPNSANAPLRMHLLKSANKTKINSANKISTNSAHKISFNSAHKATINSANKTTINRANKTTINSANKYILNSANKYMHNSSYKYVRNNGDYSNDGTKNANNKRPREEQAPPCHLAANKRRALQPKHEDNLLPPSPQPGAISADSKLRLKTENRSSPVYRMAHAAVKKKLFAGANNNENETSAERATKLAGLMQPRVTFATPGDSTYRWHKENVSNAAEAGLRQTQGMLGGLMTPREGNAKQAREGTTPQTLRDNRSPLFSASTPRQVLVHPGKAVASQTPVRTPRFQNLTPSQKTGTSYLRVQDSQVKSSSGLFVSPSSTHQVCLCYGKGAVCEVCLSRPVKHVARAGTPGFRPPEVLFKYEHQTTAVDMWAAGVVLLGLVSASYPFFKAPNDITALSEIAVIFGSDKMKEIARLLGRRVEFSDVKRPLSVRKLCEALRGRRHARRGTADGRPICAECLQFVDPRDGCICEDDEDVSSQGGEVDGEKTRKDGDHVSSQGGEVEEEKTRKDDEDISSQGGEVEGEKAKREEKTKEVEDDNVFPASVYDLLARLMDLNPHTRITAEDALKHPFFQVE